MQHTKKEIANCQKCNQPFEFSVIKLGTQEYRQNGSVCPTCKEKACTELRKTRYNAEFQTKTIEGRAIWGKTCGLSGVLLNKTFENFDANRQIHAFQAIKNYHGNSITLLSPQIYGIGKTHLVCALVNKLIKEGEPIKPNPDFDLSSLKIEKCPAYFVPEPALLDRFYKSFKENKETSEDIYSFLTSVELLVIDDVGKVQPKDPSFLQSVYYQIIDGRMLNELPIILTTNLDYNQLELHLGGASADRLRGMCKDNMIKMTGKSQR